MQTSPGINPRTLTRRVLLLGGLFGAVLTLSPSRSALAQGCGFGVSTVPSVIPLSPDGSLTYGVRIVCVGPVANARVVIRFTPAAAALICWCSGGGPSGQHEFEAFTDVAGFAYFNIRGGGCLERGHPGVPGSQDFAAEVFADGVKMAECGTVSPDAVDNGGRLPTDSPSWNLGAACSSGLSDAVFHTTPLAAGSYTWCSDINGDHAVTLSDGVMLTPSLANATSCAR